MYSESPMDKENQFDCNKVALNLQRIWDLEKTDKEIQFLNRKPPSIR